MLKKKNAVQKKYKQPVSKADLSNGIQILHILNSCTCDAVVSCGKS